MLLPDNLGLKKYLILFDSMFLLVISENTDPITNILLKSYTVLKIWTCPEG